MTHRSVASSVYSALTDPKHDSHLTSSTSALQIQTKSRITSDWQPRSNIGRAHSGDALYNSTQFAEEIISEETNLEASRDNASVTPTPSYSTSIPISNSDVKSSSSLLPTQEFARMHVYSKQGPAPNLPRQSLSRKFKRVSMTLQLAAQSNGSQSFMSEFQNNIEKTRKDNPNTESRRSEYYNRLDRIESRGSSSSRGSIKEAQNSIGSDRGAHSRSFSHLTMDSHLPTKSRLSTPSGNSGNHPIQTLRHQRHPSSISVRNIIDNSSRKSGPTEDSSVLDFESLGDLISGKDEDGYASLFICARYAFQADSLQSASDASICLSFEKDDLAFVHTIDESGWGEVTLLETLQRGWIPMNYFTCAIALDSDLPDSQQEAPPVIPHGSFLKPLFASCGQFLLDPLCCTNRINQPTFSISVMNSIRDGVRILLQRTGCLSRSNDIVIQRPIVRKSRKSLLANWYQMMTKANEFRGTSTFKKIELLTLLVYQVVRKAVSFLDLWSTESKNIMRQQNLKYIQNDRIAYPLLESPPFALQRVTEINGILYSYMALVMGRLELVEHNTVGCSLLESITHHIILLLRELLFISKSASERCPDKATALDRSLDSVLSLVSAFVASVKNLVQRSECGRSREVSLHQGPDDRYLYTEEGGDLIQIASDMTRSIGKTVTSIRILLLITGDFRLTFERAYPDYMRMRIGPSIFIEKCVESMACEPQTALRGPQNSDSCTRISRYSAMKQGNARDVVLTAGGAAFAREASNRKNSRTTSFIANKEFDKFTTSAQGETPIENELLTDSLGKLIGASLRGLVFSLTQETLPPDYFFVSTFFTCVHTFASSASLLDEFIARFDADAPPPSEEDAIQPVRLMARRKLVVKMLQLWMELFWDHDHDYPILSTMINFFNETVSFIMPNESIKLIETAARLCSDPQTESTVTRQRDDTQLVERPIDRLKNVLPKLAINFSKDRPFSQFDNESFELTRIASNNSESSETSSKSVTLPMPLGVGPQSASSGPLLSSSQVKTIEKIVTTYRKILQNSWIDPNDNTVDTSEASKLNKALPKWFNLCDQSWVLSNYRPNLINFNALEMARQLTLIESHIFCNIKPLELLGKNYTAKRARLNLAPNVQQSLLFTNCLSSYVLESVLQPKLTPKVRVNTIKTWLKIAISCLYLKNFNSLAAIVTSLQSHSLTRLQGLWDLLSEKYKELFAYLAGIIHPDKNYSVYRRKLRAIMELHDPELPIVPYFSLFLLDITFVMDGNADFRSANTFLSQKLINIDKYSKLTRIIADLQLLQVKYDRNVADPHRYPETLTDNGTSIMPLASVQELILLELWKINQLNKTEQDRVWKLSCSIQPK